MCYYVSNSLTRKEMKDTFGVTYKGPDFEGSDFVNGFSLPQRVGFDSALGKQPRFEKINFECEAGNFNGKKQF